MPGSLDYIRSVLGLDLSILSFISQKLAVSLTVLAQQFKVPTEQMKQKILPLVAAKLVDEQKASTDVVYAITADGMKEVERSSKKGLAAYF
jgi:hypothetical protein